MVGRIVGSYRIVEKIGEGGMGAVYRAVDEMLDRQVAIKAIRPELAREPEIVERFRAEAKLLARVHHPAIATIYSFFHDGGELFLAMEFVRGRTLSDVLAAEGAFPWRRAVALLATALDGIEQAHCAGIIHRDLKPDNLMLTEGPALKVMDFGIARVPGSNHLTRTGLLIGTLRYVAPEQIRGEEVDRRTDLYALGVVLYQMLTGRVPFEGRTDFAILKAQLEEPPAPPRSLAPEVPDWLERIVLKALEKEPDRRFQTAEELRIFLAGQGSLPLPGESGQELPMMALPACPAVPPIAMPAVAPATTAPPDAGTSYRPVGKARWKLAALAAGLVLAAATVAFFLSEHRGPPPVNAPTQQHATTSVAAPAPGRSPVPTAAAQPATTPLTTSAPPPQAAQPTALTVASQPLPSFASPPRPREMPKPAASPPARSQPPARPEPVTSEPTPTQAATPAPAEPAPAPETPPEPTAGDLSQDLPQLAGELAESSDKLTDLYSDFLSKKENGGAQLTDADKQLKDEIEALSDAASHFNKGINKNFFARTWSHLKGANRQADILQRAQGFAAALGRVEQRMAEARPGPEVRQGLHEVRRRWTRLAQMIGAR
jgi:tRNA A-37 threonylcarbamoyl transferase component Bud32